MRTSDDERSHQQQDRTQADRAFEDTAAEDTPGDQNPETDAKLPQIGDNLDRAKERVDDARDGEP